MESKQSRELTDLEVREQFFRVLVGNLIYWRKVTMTDEVRQMYAGEITWRMSGLVFSFLNMLDGTNISLPAFEVVPMPHPDDKAYRIDQGENYYPDNNEAAAALRGCLHGDTPETSVLLHELWHAIEKRYGIGNHR